MTSVATAWIAEHSRAPDLSWQAPIHPRQAAGDSALTHLVGRNLRRLRRQHRMSLEELARRSGVSRAMLGQIEQAKSVPSIKTLWQVAQALDVSVSWFLDPGHEPGIVRIEPPRDSPPLLRHATAEMRSLQQVSEVSRDGFFEIRLAPGGALSLPAAAAVRRVNVAVAFGVLHVAVEEVWQVLKPREALQFETAQALAWRNVGQTQVQAYVTVHGLGRTA
ncbi:MAG: helix-turn-helix transcriptional regulator [Aquabacterium sp.]